MFRSECFPAARRCDCCASAAALVFCRSDGSFMCMRCDAGVHKSGERHERVWVCEVCEQAPAEVTCKADAAALCFACDHDIHSANPLARKHDRTTIVPFYDTAESVVSKSTDATPFLPIDNNPNYTRYGGDMGSLDSWNMPITSDSIAGGPDVKSIEFLFSDSDHFLDFDLLTDIVVPDQTITMRPPNSISEEQSSENRFEIDFSRSNNINDSYSYTTSSLSLSVSSSSMELGSALSDASFPIGMGMNSIVDFNGSQGFPIGFGGTDREARVMRYREKRKNRKFQKTVRYASRKAYAETRPRIKGRFAKRTDNEPDDMDPVFFSVSDADYGFAMSF